MQQISVQQIKNQRKVPLFLACLALPELQVRSVGSHLAGLFSLTLGEAELQPPLAGQGKGSHGPGCRTNSELLIYPTAPMNIHSTDAFCQNSISPKTDNY